MGGITTPHNVRSINAAIIRKIIKTWETKENRDPNHFQNLEFPGTGSGNLFFKFRVPSRTGSWNPTKSMFLRVPEPVPVHVGPQPFSKFRVLRNRFWNLFYKFRVPKNRFWNPF
jgi:hypothetical protein